MLLEAVPTILRFGPYRFFFYASDQDEPPHVHIEREANIAKFWLNPVRLQNSGGFNRRELNQIQRLVEQQHEELVRGWNDYFHN